MKSSTAIAQFSIDQPKLIVVLTVIITLSFTALAALPTIWPDRFSALHPVRIDTDPENMLSTDEPIRIFNREMKNEMSIRDLIVLGVLNEKNPQGVFNPESLTRIYELTKFAKGLEWPDPKNPDKRIGVVPADIIAPSTVDNIEQGGPGVVKFDWLMSSPPQTPQQALAVRQKAERIPFLEGTLLSEDGKAVCIYLPITSKDVSYRIYSALQQKIREFTGDERYYITGLPVAEDTFGVEMFRQMAISAPIAMVIIFLLMLFFFRKPVLVISPMIVAMICPLCTMSLLVISGATIHIMSSMIPIFIVPIAVLDAVHILSEFFDRYQDTKDRRKTVISVMEELFTPMLYTSITTAVGFGSLALAPIPPVQVFGLFVSFGVLLAWILTVTFIPAYIMFIPDRSLEKFGRVRTEGREGKATFLGSILGKTGNFAYRRARMILMITVLLTLVAGFGISLIKINDNPVNWFPPDNPIRIADRVLNRHFGGTYMAYLALESETSGQTPRQYVEGMAKRLNTRLQEIKGMPEVGTVFEALKSEAVKLGREDVPQRDVLDRLEQFAVSSQFAAPDEEKGRAWDEALIFIDREKQRGQVFKQPEALAYVSRLQRHLQSTEVVGKSNSLSDIVKTVYRELLSGRPADFKIPDTANGVAQTLITYQNSHRPQDLWHFVTPDYRKTVLWVQLKSGDNRDMSKVVRTVGEFSDSAEAPFPIKPRWFGLTYLNMVWQEKMVAGMLESFAGSFLCVFLIMTILYRSAIWGFVCMIPLTVTIVMIYGAIGLIGKDYDMPVAVLSSLSLGLAVDYAIHFLSRGRRVYEEQGDWGRSVEPMFQEPARAIFRNVLVIGIGFTPLLFAPLVPYQTVGIFIASILLLAGAATLILLPSLMTVWEGWLFPATDQKAFVCNSGTCLVSAAAAIAVVAINLHQFEHTSWPSLSWVAAVAMGMFILICLAVGRGQKCS